MINERDRCKTCQGKKTIDQKKKLEVVISPGSRNEQQIRFPGESDQAPNMDPGDVIVVLQQEPHHLFQRNGDNLIMKHKINLVESLCGFQLVITHLDQRKLVLTHPPNDPIAPSKKTSINAFFSFYVFAVFLGTFRCVKGQGMINMRTHETGDLIVQFDVEFPPEKFFSDSQTLKVEILFYFLFK